MPSLDRETVSPGINIRGEELRNPVSSEPHSSQHEGGVLDQETLIHPVHQPHQDEAEEERLLPVQTALPGTEEAEKERE